MADNTINLILNLQGTERAKALQEYIRALDQSLKAGAVTATEYEDELHLLAEATGQSAAELARLSAAAGQQAQALEQTVAAERDATAALDEKTAATGRQAAALGSQADLLGHVEAAQGKLTASTERLKADVYEFADAYEVLESKAGAVARSFAIFEDAALDVSRASDQVNEALAQEGSRLSGVGQSAERAAALHAEAAAQLVRDSGTIQAALDAEADEAEQTEMREATAFAKAAERHEQEMGRVVASQGRLGAASAATGRGMSDLSQRMTALSYAFQDFTSSTGDIGMKLNSVSNNIPNILTGLGKAAIAISVVTTAGIALYRSWDDIARALETKNPFPGAATDVANLTRQFDKAKESLTKLEGYSSLTTAELAKYNTLRTRTVELEKQIADQQERQANYKKAIEGKAAEVEERKAGVAEALQGAGPQFERDLTLALAGQGQQERLAGFQAERDRKLAEIREKIAPEFQERAMQPVLAEYARRERSILEGFDDLAKTLMVELTNGSKVAHERVERLIRDNVAAFARNLGPETIAKFFENTPEAKQEAEHTADVLERAAEAHRQQQEIDRETQALRVEQGGILNPLTNQIPLPAPPQVAPVAQAPAGPAVAAAPAPAGFTTPTFAAPAAPGFEGMGAGFGPVPPTLEAYAAPFPVTAAPARPRGPRTVEERIIQARQRRSMKALAQKQRNERLKQQRELKKRQAQERYRQSRVGRADRARREQPLALQIGPGDEALAGLEPVDRFAAAAREGRGVTTHAVTPGPRRGAPAGAGGGAGGALAPALAQQTGVARQSVAAQQMGLQAVSALYAENQRLSATITQVYQAYRQLAGQTEARTKNAARRLP